MMALFKKDLSKDAVIRFNMRVKLWPDRSKVFKQTRDAPDAGCGQILVCQGLEIGKARCV
jgi:hypothetical protein